LSCAEVVLLMCVARTLASASECSSVAVDGEWKG